MNTEFEATFTGVNPDQIRSQLKTTGATLIKENRLLKRYSFAVPETCSWSNAWIRVRDEGDIITMTLKSVPLADALIHEQKETEVQVDDFNAARLLLQNLGLVEESYQETYREEWKLDGVEVCIDEWPWLEPFVEIEGEDEASVGSVASKLGFDYTAALFNSVDEQYRQEYGIEKDVINSHTPRFVFGEPNPFV